jgi:hypothetical protein
VQRKKVKAETPVTLETFLAWKKKKQVLVPRSTQQLAVLDGSDPKWAHPAHICAGTGLTAATPSPGLGSPLRHLHRDWATSGYSQEEKAAAEERADKDSKSKVKKPRAFLGLCSPSP